MIENNWEILNKDDREMLSHKMITDEETQTEDQQQGENAQDRQKSTKNNNHKLMNK